jgi:hypothetical protein
VATNVSDNFHVHYMLDMFSLRKSSSFLSNDADLGLRKDRVFRSDPFSLHVIEQLIFSLKLLLKINDIVIPTVLYSLSVPYCRTQWTD